MNVFLAGMYDAISGEYVIMCMIGVDCIMIWIINMFIYGVNFGLIGVYMGIICFIVCDACDLDYGTC